MYDYHSYLLLLLLPPSAEEYINFESRQKNVLSDSLTGTPSSNNVM